MAPGQLLRSLEQQRQPFLHELEEIVALETPSGEKAALDAFAEVLASKVRAVDGARIDLVRDELNGNHLRAEWVGNPDSRPVLAPRPL